VAATLIAAGVATVMAVADFPAIPIDRCRRGEDDFRYDAHEAFLSSVP
jgi:hypothetical protein